MLCNNENPHITKFYLHFVFFLLKGIWEVFGVQKWHVRVSFDPTYQRNKFYQFNFLHLMIHIVFLLTSHHFARCFHETGLYFVEVRYYYCWQKVLVYHRRIWFFLLLEKSWWGLWSRMMNKQLRNIWKYLHNVFFL